MLAEVARKVGRKLTPVPLEDVRIEGGFWGTRQEVNGRVTIPLEFAICERTNRWRAFDPGWKVGDRQARHRFWDSDVAKLLEAAAYEVVRSGDKRIRRLLEEKVALVVRAAQPDGYLNSYYSFAAPEERFRNLRDNHELYCAGHLMEAAVAHYRATGARFFLEAMERYAELLERTFGRGPGQKRGYCGHQEIELALVKMYGVTGEGRWLRLAKYFIDERGRRPYYFDEEARGRGEDPRGWYFKTYEYMQAHKPVREQEEAVGHAVRCLYMLCGMADVGVATDDEVLVAACERMWRSICERRMLLTGGVGTDPRNEGFSYAYDIPDEYAYAETCAAIANVFFNHRMLQIRGDGKYADVMERALYNGVASGVSLDGRRFFYSNPLAVHEPDAGGGRRAGGEVWDGLTRHRQEWFGCACCPPNIARLYAGLGGYMYSRGERGVYVHLYVAGEGWMEVAGQRVRVVQETNYPWEGRVVVRVHLERATEFTLYLRMPGWCDEAELKVKRGKVDLRGAVREEKGYIGITREWGDGDEVELDLAMPVRRVYAHPEVRQLAGRVALQRGPIVYCVEGCDNATQTLERLALPRGAELKAVFEPELLGGVTVIEGKGLLLTGVSDQLYSTAAPRHKHVRIRAVPYCVWDNRTPGSMRVWLREVE
ncbi:MAG: glycoside hydrolase family 127 protein [bacterium]|nr:glycoside hydrolase family 127 protein [bacterium]